MVVATDAYNPALAMAEAQQHLKSLGTQMRASEQYETVFKIINSFLRAGVPNLSKFLPLVLTLKGNPYTLQDHFPFEPFYSVHMPDETVFCTARQVGKSTDLAGQGVLSMASLRHFNSLYVTPQFEQVRKFSNNYVRAFIEESPFRKLWTSSQTAGNVLQRQFVNKSNMFFSYAFLSPDRCRGINADRVTYDEAQDIDESFLGVINECLSGSKWGLKQYAGTPKLKAGTLAKLYDRSSQGEWEIRCGACGYDNVPSMDYHLDKMIGPFHPEIGQYRGGVLCARPRCRLPIDPRQGRWRHRHPGRLGTCAGYHIPQIILPMHYASRKKWGLLLNKQQSYPTHLFYNEVCGEAYDLGAALISETELIAAGVLHENNLNKALATINQYETRVISIDWGGGGEKEDSWTTIAILGWKDGKIHVIFGYRSMTPHDQIGEANIIIDLINKFKCQFMVHDYNGAGANREHRIHDAGFPMERIMPVAYVGACTQKMIRLVKGDEAKNPRTRFHLDKPRSLVTTCHELKAGNVLTFKYDKQVAEEGIMSRGCLEDFLALVEIKKESLVARDTYRIGRRLNTPDDFAHSVNMGCCWLWWYYDAFPPASIASRYRISSELLNELSPDLPDWDAADPYDWYGE